MAQTLRKTLRKTLEIIVEFEEHLRALNPHEFELRLGADASLVRFCFGNPMNLHNDYNLLVNVICESWEEVAEVLAYLVMQLALPAGISNIFQVTDTHLRLYVHANQPNLQGKPLLRRTYRKHGVDWIRRLTPWEETLIPSDEVFSLEAFERSLTQKLEGRFYRVDTNKK